MEPKECRPSLSDILADEELALLLRNFMKQNQCVENLKFWIEVVHFRETKMDQTERLERANDIYAKYLHDKAECLINVDHSLKQDVSVALQDSEPLSPDLYLQMELQIYGLMEFDIYRKFIASQAFKNWCKSLTFFNTHSFTADNATPKRKKAFLGLFSSGRKKKNGSFSNERSDSVLQLQNHVKNHKKVEAKE